MDCGISDPRILEFDHVYGEKEWNISELVRGGASEDELVREMAKCQIRCCNCHRLRHCEEGDRNRVAPKTRRAKGKFKRMLDQARKDAGHVERITE